MSRILTESSLPCVLKMISSGWLRPREDTN